jgi:hypothetical protein
MRPESDWSMIARARRVASTMSRVRMRCLMRGMLRGAIDSERSQKSVGRSASNRCRWRSAWPRRDVGRPAVSPKIVGGRDEGNCRAAMTAKGAECAALFRLTFAGPDTPFRLNPASRVLSQLSPSGATCSDGR